MNNRTHNQYTLLESMGMAAIVLDHRLMIQFLNTEAKRVLGQDAANLVGKLLDELIPPSFETETARPAELIQKIHNLRSCQSTEIQTMLSRPNGAVFIGMAG